MNNKNLFSFFFLFAALVLFMSGCMPLRPPVDPLMDKKAFLISNEARSFNRHIISSKGKGWVKLETPIKTDRYRIVWAAAYPDKARITFFLSGHPLETMVFDGKKISFFSHTGKHSLYSRHSEDPDMKDFLEVPVKMSELISILLGQLPLKGFDEAYFSPLDSSLATIILHQKDRGRVQNLNFSTNKKIRDIQSVDRFGNPLYEVRVLDYKTFDFGDIPITLQILDMDDRKLILDITDFEPNPLIKESVFELTGPG